MSFENKAIHQYIDAALILGWPTSGNHTLSYFVAELKSQKGDITLKEAEVKINQFYATCGGNVNHAVGMGMGDLEESDSSKHLQKSKDYLLIWAKEFFN